MSTGQLKQVILAGEVLQIKVNDASEFEAVEAYAKATLDRFVRIDSPDSKKQILLAVMVLCSEVLKLRKQLESRQEMDEKGVTQLNELLSLITDTLEVH